MVFHFLRRGYCVLLSGLLCACTDPTAFRVTGPILTQGHEPTFRKQLDYTVYNFAPTDSCRQVLLGLAYRGVIEEGSADTFQVTFTDATTHHTLLSQTMVVHPDLLFQNKAPIITDTYGSFR
ncbi:MAG: hypothetical protein ACRYG7_05575 [Janthinobacterium lividum]